MTVQPSSDEYTSRLTRLYRYRAHGDTSTVSEL